MDKVNFVKEGVSQLITNYLGEPTAKTFQDFYGEETLPVYIDAVLKILADFIGEGKAKGEIREILSKNNIENIYV